MSKKGVDRAVRIPCKAGYSFFKMWLLFLEPFHHLTQREMDVAAALIKHRYELSKVVSDENLLDKLVLGDDVKSQVREECNMSIQHFQVILGKLKKARVIVENKLNPRYIPNVEADSSNFKLLLLFDFNEG